MGVEVRSQMPVAKIWSLIEELNTRQLCNEVREALKRRYAIVAEQQTLYDGLHTTVAIE